MNRRTLLRLAAMVVLLLPARLHGAIGAQRWSRASALRGFFSHPESAAVIGREYLRLCPEETEPQRLLAGLLPDIETWPAGEALRRALAERQSDDFASGRTVMLDGWVLSRTEARLCAAASLGLC